jgi:type IV secretory pathway component VirB8
MEQNFEAEVLARLAVIESKLDDYKSTREKTEEAYDLAKHNKERLDRLEDNNKWAFRTAIGAIITSVIALVFLFIQIGIGLK